MNIDKKALKGIVDDPVTARLRAMAAERHVWTHPNWSRAQIRAALNWGCPTYRANRAASHKRAIERVQAGEGSIYVAQVEGATTIKIGFALGSVEIRLRNVLTDFGVKVSLIKAWPGSLSDEQRLHRRLRRFRDTSFHGREFYRAEVLGALAL